MSKYSLKTLTTLFLFSVCLASYTVNAGVMEEVSKVQHDWAHANYELSGKDQTQAFETLVGNVEVLTDQYADSAEIFVWSGIVKSTYAGVKGGLGALSLAKQSRSDLEHAIEIDGDVLDGSAYTSLATLYAQVPGWPIGFGSEKKAKALFDKALNINPNGIDSNYFYAQFMFDQKNYAEAKRYFLKAQQAEARPGREVADAGRQQEILAGLEKTNKKLH